LSPATCNMIRLLAGRFPGDPANYVSRYLGKTLTPQQAEVLRALQRPPYRVLVPSANNVGKTFLAACVASWFYDSFDPSILLAVAPNQRSIRDVFFRTLRDVRPFKHGFMPRASRLQSGHSHFVDGLTAQKSDAFQGRHESAIAIVFDEATGIDREFWDRAGTMLNGTPPQFHLCLYNPNDSSSPAYAAEDSGLWNVVRLSALDHPNVAAELRGEPPPVPSAIRLSRIRARIAAECEPGEGDTSFPFDGIRYVPRTPEFEAQVLGRWPSVSLASVWTDALFRRCLEPRDLDPNWPVQIGCDVARFGDDETVIAVRKGLRLVELVRLRSADTREIAYRLRSSANNWSVTPKAIPTLIDNTGGYGTGVVDYADGWQWIGVNSSEAAIDHRFPNRRSELWFHCREAAEAGGCDFSVCPDGDRLRRHLLSARYRLDNGGRRRVEPKRETKARLGESPDLADAVNLAWYPLR
jgi:hypothetical protein